MKKNSRKSSWIFVSVLSGNVIFLRELSMSVANTEALVNRLPHRSVLLFVSKKC